MVTILDVVQFSLEDMVLIEKIIADGFLEAWRNNDWLTYGAWLDSDWSGAIKPSVDRVKDVKAYEGMAKNGWITRDRASKELTGTKFSNNVKRLQKENEQLVSALEPLLNSGIIKQQSFNALSENGLQTILEKDDILQEIQNAVEDIINDRLTLQ